jgi:beta-1,4-N-acetylglucosaminyltransferase
VQRSQKHGKRCFVTIGATAPFNSLIQAVLQPSFVDALSRAGYGELRVQYGNHEGESLFQSRTKELNASPHVPKLEITGFGFDKAGLGTEMVALKGSAEVEQGTVISHAGKSAMSLARS